MAANWSARPPSPRGTLASPPHQPYRWTDASTSTNPASPSNRGGAVGSSAYPIMPSAVLATSQVRAKRYRDGCARYIQTSTIGVIR